MRGLSLVAASGGHSSSRCAGLSLSRPLLLWSTGSRCAGSVAVAHGPSSSAACGIFPDQGSNPCPLRWQADSQPLRHQGSPMSPFCLANIRHSLGSGYARFTARLKSQLYYLLSMWPWTNHNTSLCLNSLIYKLRTLILSISYFFYNFCENSTKQCTVLQI